MYASLKELIAAKTGTYYGRLHYYHRVTRSPRKGRRYRIQQIFNDKRFVIKQIIHVIN